MVKVCTIIILSFGEVNGEKWKIVLKSGIKVDVKGVTTMSL